MNWNEGDEANKSQNNNQKVLKKVGISQCQNISRWIFPLFPLTFSLIYQSTHTKKKRSTPSNTRAHRAHKYYTPSHWSSRLGRCHSCGIYHQLSSGRTGRREASHLFHTPASGTLSPGKQVALQSQRQTYIVLLLLLFHNDLLLLLMSEPRNTMETNKTVNVSHSRSLASSSLTCYH